MTNTRWICPWVLKAVTALHQKTGKLCLNQKSWWKVFEGTINAALYIVIHHNKLPYQLPVLPFFSHSTSKCGRQITSYLRFRSSREVLRWLQSVIRWQTFKMNWFPRSERQTPREKTHQNKQFPVLLLLSNWSLDGITMCVALCLFAVLCEGW